MAQLHNLMKVIADRRGGDEFYSDVSCDALLRAFLQPKGESHHMLTDLPPNIIGHISFAQNSLGMGHAGLADTWNVFARLMVELSFTDDIGKSDWFSSSKKKADKAIARDLDRMSDKLPSLLHDLGVWGGASAFLFAWEFSHNRPFRDLIKELWTSKSPARDSLRFNHSVLNRFQWPALDAVVGSKNTFKTNGNIVWSESVDLDTFVRCGKTDVLMCVPEAAIETLCDVADTATMLKLLVDNYGFLKKAYLDYQERPDKTTPFLLQMFYCPEKNKPHNPDMYADLCRSDPGFLTLHRLQEPLNQMFYLCQQDSNMDTPEQLIGNLHNTLSVPLRSHVCFLGMSREPEVERTLKGYLPDHQIFIDYSVAFQHGYRSISTEDLKAQMKLSKLDIPVVEMKKTSLTYEPGSYCFTEVMCCHECRRLLQPDECLQWNGRYFCLKQTDLGTENGNCILKYYCKHNSGMGQSLMFYPYETDEQHLVSFALNSIRGGSAFGFNPTMRRVMSFVIDRYINAHDPLEFMKFQSQHIVEYLQRFCVDQPGSAEKLAHVSRCQVQWQAQLHTMDNISKSLEAMKCDNVKEEMAIQLYKMSFHAFCMQKLQQKYGVDVICYLTTSRYAASDVNFECNMAVRDFFHIPNRGDVLYKVNNQSVALFFPEEYTRGLAHCWLGALFMANRIPLSVHYRVDLQLKALACKVARYFILVRLNACLKWKLLSNGLLSCVEAAQHHKATLLSNVLTHWPNKKMADRTLSAVRHAFSGWKMHLKARQSIEEAIVSRACKKKAFKLLSNILGRIKQHKREVALRCAKLWLTRAKRIRRDRCLNKLYVFGSFHAWKSKLGLLKRDKILSAYVVCMQEMRRESTINKAFHGWRKLARQWIQMRSQHASVVRFKVDLQKKVLAKCFRYLHNKCLCRRALLSRFIQRKEHRIKRVFLAQLSFLVEERRVDADAFVSKATGRVTSKLNSNAESFVPVPKPTPPPPLPPPPSASLPNHCIGIPVYPVHGPPFPVTSANVIAHFLRNAHSQMTASEVTNPHLDPGLACVNFGFGNYPVITNAVGVYGQGFMG